MLKNNLLKILIIIFFIGLLIHFFLYNFISFGLGINLGIFWLWKEFFIIFFIILLIFYTLRSKYIKQFFHSKTILIIEIAFLFMILLAFVINVILGDSTIGHFIIAFKYDFMGFLIFFIFYHLGYFIEKSNIEYIIKFYGLTIKFLLILALIWYSIIIFKPGFFNFFGYDKSINEGGLGESPPIIYLTQFNHGYVRNQFIFERPINWGFFLIGFWPLFYSLFLRRKSIYKNSFWWGIYCLNIILTFSRAAWIAWIFEILILGLLEYRKNIKIYLIRIILPVIVVVGLISSLLFNDIVMRYFSNSGHIKLMSAGFEMLMEDFWTGKGPAMVGPGSHQICSLNNNIEFCKQIETINRNFEIYNLKGFNTENQFLQIAVEFGIIIFLFWFMIYTVLNVYGLYRYIISTKSQLKHEYIWLLIAFTIGMIGLSIEGMMLHSFVDRMIVYPMMVLYGLIFSVYTQKKVLDFPKK